MRGNGRLRRRTAGTLPRECGIRPESVEVTPVTSVTSLFYRPSREEGRRERYVAPGTSTETTRNRVPDVTDVTARVPEARPSTPFESRGPDAGFNVLGPTKSSRKYGRYSPFFD